MTNAKISPLVVALTVTSSETVIVGVKGAALVEFGADSSA